jgi:hypothetical protein
MNNKALQRPSFTKPAWKDCWLVFYVEDRVERSLHFLSEEEAQKFIQKAQANPEVDCSSTPEKVRRKM